MGGSDEYKYITASVLAALFAVMAAFTSSIECLRFNAQAIEPQA